MTLEITIFSVLTAVIVAGVVLAVMRNRRMRELRDLLEFSQNQIDELHDAIIRTREAGETSQRRASDQARRIAWLESKIRKPKLSPDEVLDDSVITETPKLSMTERRHRVINLASRGKNVETIATSLGLFNGEVELILSLNKAAAGQK
jgi:DNA-binding NarL/FixJ family response regulator